MIAASFAFPDIDPVIFQIGPVAIRWYALAYIAGLVLGWRYVIRLISDKSLWVAKSPATVDQIDDLLLWATFGVILGGRLGFVLFYQPGYYVSHPADIIAVWKGGMSFHGGMLGMVAAIILFARRRAMAVLSLGDLVAAAAPIGLFFGRLANFINGELWGRVTDVPWGVVFRGPGAGPYPRHPSQLYEAALEGVALFALLAVFTYKTDALKRPGTLCGTFLIGYGIARIAVEFFREPDAQVGFLAGGLTMGMLLSLPMILAGGALVWWADRQWAAFGRK